MKRSRLRPVSKKWLALKARWKHERETFRDEHPRCMCCGERPTVDVHEIARGPNRHLAYGEICCWLAVCRHCHDQLDNLALWPLEMQLAVKYDRDREHFDLARFNEIRSRSPHAITIEEVLKWLAK